MVIFSTISTAEGKMLASWKWLGIAKKTCSEVGAGGGGQWVVVWADKWAVNLLKPASGGSALELRDRLFL